MSTRAVVWPILARATANAYERVTHIPALIWIKTARELRRNVALFFFQKHSQRSCRFVFLVRLPIDPLCSDADMKLTFLGTRGEIEISSRRHRRHSALLVEQGNGRIMIDCGADWLDRVGIIRPTAILLTHAHRDHAAGLARGAPCPVYATTQTLDLLWRYPLGDCRIIEPGKAVIIAGVRFKAFPVHHSIRAPAVGYRVTTKTGSFFYLPDVADLPDATQTLHGTDIYVGDGATITRSMVRKRNGSLIGHAAIDVQLGWCERAGVRQAIFTHCGSYIVRGDGRIVNSMVQQLGRARGVNARLACDGDQLTV